MIIRSVYLKNYICSVDEAGGISLKLYKIIKRKAGLEGKKACLRQEVGRKATIGVKNERKGNAL